MKRLVSGARINNLGLARYEANQFSEAKEVLASTLADQSRVLGEGHPDTIQTAIHLGLALLDLHDKDGLTHAEKTYRQARETLGPRHPLTLDAQSMYAWILRLRGEIEQALENAKPAAIGLRKVKGAEDPRAMYAAYNYGTCLSALHRYKEAAAVFEPLLAVRYRILGPTHIDSLYAAWRLAECRRMAGDESGAIEVLERVHSNLKSIETLENIKRGDPLNTIAGVYVRSANDCAAEFHAVVYRMYVEALRRGEPQKINIGLLVYLVKVWTAAPQAELRNYDWALELATKACEITAYRDPRMITALATAQAAREDYEAATKSFDKSLELQPDNLENHYSRALVCLRSGNLAGYRADCEAMSKHFAASTDQSTRYWLAWTCGLGPGAINDLGAVLKQARDLAAQSPENAAYRDSLGALLYRTGNYEEAAKQLSEGVAIHKKGVASNASAAYSQFFLAMSQQRLGDKAEAKRIIADAEKAMDEEVKADVPWNRRAALELFRREAKAELSEPNIGTSAVAPK